jgi:hypothetical protein
MANNPLGTLESVDVSSGTPEVVALAMANAIRARELVSRDPKYPLDPCREYWLTLYAQCLAVVRGQNPLAPPVPSETTRPTPP